MGSVIRRARDRIAAAGGMPADEFFMLSHDASCWRAEHFIAVSKEVPGMEMVTLTGTYLAKVFDGPFRDAGKWEKDMVDFVNSKGKQIRTCYFFYTTCPKCAKFFGRNYVVGFAEV